MTRTAYCKINLTLEILGTNRDDGFHDLKTIMHKIPLGDKISVDVEHGNGKIKLMCDSDVCSPEENLAYKAAKAYLDKCGGRYDITIKLAKVTPTGAGLGGGSADAACVLDMLYELVGGLPEDDVLKIAAQLGSDVPFCLDRYTSAYCTGRGEICRNIAVLPPCHMIVAKPIESINTKGIYGEYDKAYGDDYTKAVSDSMEKALLDKDLKAVSQALINDFERVCIPRLPKIAVIKRQLVSHGALCSQMSGSGSAVFGIFDDEGKAQNCLASLKEKGLKEAFLLTNTDFEKMYNGE